MKVSTLSKTSEINIQQKDKCMILFNEKIVNSTLPKCRVTIAHYTAIVILMRRDDFSQFAAGSHFFGSLI